MSELTRDKFLGGKLTVGQFKEGFRAGLDAVMVAAAVPAKTADAILELGAGCGTASLCLACRVADCVVQGVEIDAALLALAQENARANAMESRVTFVEGDALGGDIRADFDHVFANPPFHGDDGQVSPHAGRERAKRDSKGLGAWVEAGLRRTRSRGTLTLIIRADRLREVLIAAPDTGASVFPLWPRKDEVAKRVIVQIVKGSSAPLRMLSGLVLHESDGRYAPEADAVLRGEAHLEL